MNSGRFLLRTSHLFLSAVSAAFIATACEHYDFEQEEDNKEEGNVITPPSKTGAGTYDSPLTASELIEGADTLMGREVWVIGYAVGETYRSLSNATFTPPFEYTSNLLISVKANCDNVADCVPVELSSTKQKSVLALSNNPDHYRDCVLLQGKVQKFFSTTGLRSLTAYYWLPDYIIKNSSPTEWDEEHETYD